MFREVSNYDDFTDFMGNNNASVYDDILGIGRNGSSRVVRDGSGFHRIYVSEILLGAILLILIVGMVTKVYKCLRFRRKSPIYRGSLYRAAGGVDGGSVEMSFGDNFGGRVGGGAGGAVGDGSNAIENWGKNIC